MIIPFQTAQNRGASRITALRGELSDAFVVERGLNSRTLQQTELVSANNQWLSN